MIIYYLLLVLNICIIIFLSFYEIESLSHLKLHRYDEFIHFVMYFFLSLVALMGTQFKFHLRNSLILFVLLALPLVTEYIQFFNPKRRPDINDLFYDYCGLLVGIIAILYYRYVKKNKDYKPRNN